MIKKLLIPTAAGALLLLAAAGFGAWLVFSSNTPAFEGERGVKIPPDASFETVLDSLEASGLLASRSRFATVARLTGWGRQIKAGHYTFEPGASVYDQLDALRKGLQTPIRLTIPPGSRPEVIAAVAAREMAFSEDAFLAALQDSTLAAALGTEPAHLFTYLLPETYFFYWLTPPEDVIRRVGEAFDRFYEETLQARADSLGLRREDLVSLAAIVEWETSLERERPRVAGVYLNRLQIGMKLDADPTIQYILLQTEGQKRRLLFKDYRIEHPYNTYRRRGLPPGPITNPSRSSLRAAANAEDHDYRYFVANLDGTHTFSKSFREHVRAANEFRRAMRERRQQRNVSTDSLP